MDPVLLNTDVSERDTYKYFMRVDPEMRDFLGPIVTDFDTITGREMKHRTAKVAMQRGSTNLKEVQVYLDPFPHIRLDKPKDMQGWYSAKGDGLLQGQRDRPCETDALLTQPYGGWCNVGCTFCYINSGNRGYRGSGLITVPMNYGAFVKKQLSSLKFAAAGYFSSFTEPFMEIEDYYHNTKDGAQAFVDAGLPIFFLSRMQYPDWSLDLLRKNPYSYAQKSINTSDPVAWKKLTPAGIGLEENFEDLKRIHEAGIYISIQVNPVIPGVISHEDIERLFVRLAECGVDHVIVKFVEANYPWAKTLTERFAKKFPAEKMDIFRSLFVENSCGGQKTITEDYRREGHTRYQKLATKLGMTYSLCYEYTKKSGRWKSMGPEFLTSAQCHGHRVPMHANIGSQFAPMEVCPPSGCLRCSDENKGIPRCGSEVLGAAGALRLPVMRRDPKIISLMEVS